jgi:hypothetical protein
MAHVGLVVGVEDRESYLFLLNLTNIGRAVLDAYPEKVFHILLDGKGVALLFGIAVTHCGVCGADPALVRSLSPVRVSERAFVSIRTYPLGGFGDALVSSASRLLPGLAPELTECVATLLVTTGYRHALATLCFHIFSAAGLGDRVRDVLLRSVGPHAFGKGERISMRGLRGVLDSTDPDLGVLPFLDELRILHRTDDVSEARSALSSVYAGLVESPWGLAAWTAAGGHALVHSLQLAELLGMSPKFAIEEGPERSHQALKRTSCFRRGISGVVCAKEVLRRQRLEAVLISLDALDLRTLRTRNIMS